MPHIMLDIETLGTVPGCSIISIGAVAFEPNTARTGLKFHAVINRGSCQELGLKECQDTIIWWEKQSTAAKTTYDVSQFGQPIDVAIKDFMEFCNDVAEGKTLYVWGNGSDFDNAILSYVFAALHFKMPWHYANNRCYRTIKSLAPKIKTKRQGIYHNALDDAISQSAHLQEIARQMRLKFDS